MKLIKYGHACFTVEKDNQILVIDPGNYSPDFIAPDHVVGVIITHEHADHFDPEILAQIVNKNPDVVVVGPAVVTDKLETPKTHAANAGEIVTVGPFKLEFFGGTHALIHDSIPRVANLCIMIDDLLYYPGDSLDVPNQPVDVLALPAVAPWMKIGETMDFLAAVHPRLAFPTHDAIADELGKQLADRMLGGYAQKNDIEYVRLDSPLEI